MQIRMSDDYIHADVYADEDFLYLINIYFKLWKTTFSHISPTYVLPGCGTWTQVVMHPTNHFPQPPPIGKWPLTPVGERIPRGSEGHS